MNTVVKFYRKGPPKVVINGSAPQTASADGKGFASAGGSNIIEALIALVLSEKAGIDVMGTASPASPLATEMKARIRDDLAKSKVAQHN